MPIPSSSPIPPALDQAGMVHWQLLHQQVMARMSQLAQALDGQVWIDVDRACRWLHEEFHPHNAWEEQELLPRLEAVAGRKLRRRLIADHRAMGHLTQAILQGHTDGQVRDPGGHGERARRLLNLVRQHTDTEAQVLLPLIQGRSNPPVPAETGEGYLMMPTPCYPRA
jgi:hypothetical protein